MIKFCYNKLDKDINLGVFMQRYFVEKDASEFLNMPITGKVIPFEINKRKLN